MKKNIHLLNSTFKWLFDHRKIQKRKYLQMNEKKKQNVLLNGTQEKAKIKDKLNNASANFVSII